MKTKNILAKASTGMQLAAGVFMILAGVKNTSYISAYLGAFILAMACVEIKNILSK